MESEPFEQLLLKMIPSTDTIDEKESIDLDLNPRNNGVNREEARQIFVTGLQNSGAVIAGGSVLRSYINYTAAEYNFMRDYKVNDMDIYVHANTGPFLLTELTRLGYNIVTQGNLVPAYDQSFFRRNHILARFRLKAPFKKIVNLDFITKFPEIDIMIIKNEIPIQQVVTNFDLTFCQIWYDGNQVRRSPDLNPGDLENRIGFLQEEYRPAYFSGNRFIQRRIAKYRSRGFTVNVGPVPVVAPVILRTVQAEEWVVKKLYEYYLRDRSRRERFMYVCAHPLSNPILAELPFPLSDDFKLDAFSWSTNIGQPYITYINQVLGITQQDITNRMIEEGIINEDDDEDEFEFEDEEEEEEEFEEEEIPTQLLTDYKEVVEQHREAQLGLVDREQRDRFADGFPLYDSNIHLMNRTYRQLSDGLWKNPLAPVRINAPVCMEVHNAVRAFINPLYSMNTLIMYQESHPRERLTDRNLIINLREIMRKCISGKNYNIIFRNVDLCNHLIEDILSNLRSSLDQNIELSGHPDIIEPDESQRITVNMRGRDIISNTLFFMIDHSEEVLTCWVTLFTIESATAYIPIEDYRRGRQISCPAGIVERMLLNISSVLCPNAPRLISLSNEIDMWFPEFAESLGNDPAVEDLPIEEQETKKRERDRLWNEFVESKIQNESVLIQAYARQLLSMPSLIEKLNITKYSGK